MGYLQSMNFVAGFSLIVFGRAREADAFAAFDTLVSTWLGGYYSEDMAVLKASHAARHTTPLASLSAYSHHHQ